MSPERPARVVVTGDGPVLLEGPVEIDLPDGRRVVSQRPVTALCVCGRRVMASFGRTRFLTKSVG